VDGYYPGNKLVVVWHASPEARTSVYSELVPAHGFRLLELTPEAVGADPAEAEARLRARIEKLGPAPRRAQEAQSRESRLAFAPAAAQQARPGPARAPVAETVPLGAGFGAVLGVVLLVVLVAEVYLGVAVVGAGHGQPLLALAFALDAGARALGTIDAGHAGLPDWAWLCALGGSPLVAAFASQQRQGTVAVQAAPLAGAISLMAMALAVLGGLVALASG
jgi:hypothetical protein